MPSYHKTLIDATLSYLRKEITHAHDPDFVKGTLEEYVDDSVKKGLGLDLVGLSRAARGQPKAGFGCVEGQAFARSVGVTARA